MNHFHDARCFKVVAVIPGLHYATFGLPDWLSIFSHKKPRRSRVSFCFDEMGGLEIHTAHTTHAAAVSAAAM